MLSLLVAATAATSHAQQTKTSAILGATSTVPVVMTTSSPTNDPVAARADTLAAQGDVAGAVSFLESKLFPHSTNAAAWQRYGLLQWRLAAANRRAGSIADPKTIKALQRADSALRLATQFARDSAEYWLSLAHFNLQSGVSTMRFAAQSQMSNAVEAATRVADSVRLAESADELGMAVWRRFESTRNRALVGAGQHAQLQTDGRWSRAHGKDYLETFAKKIQPPTGDADYASALEQFRTAMRARPNALQYSRHMYMGLAVGKQWEALLTLASSRATASAFDADARLARGLALQRLRRAPEAKAAFDSALVMMDENESGNLFRIDRILPTGANVLTGARGMDQKSFATLPAGQRTTMSALFWTLNDPNPATPENEAYLEFMARIVQADWQWSDAIQGLRGVDTDRGDIFVRYGPPDDEMTLNGISSVQQDIGVFQESGGSSSSQDVGSTIAWIYNSGEVFFFDVAPGFGTARTPLTDQKYVAEVGSVKPAAWTNVAAPRRVDSLPLRTVRFRGPGDSTDVVIVSRIPLRSLVADTLSALDSTSIDGTLRVDVATIDGAARVVSRDSTKANLTRQNFSHSTTRTWTRRVGTGAAFVRVDATLVAAHSDEQRAAMATTAVDAPRPSGFALSDVLLVTAASTPTGNAARWRDLNVTPSIGTYRAGDKIGLAWETYDLTETGGNNKYRIALHVERLKRTGAAGLAIRLVDQLGALLKQERATSDQLTLTFDRTVAARPIQVDYLALDWQGDARGEYRLVLTITDLQTNKITNRETRFRID